jgi:type VI secretion system secreted protein VgrG
VNVFVSFCLLAVAFPVAAHAGPIVDLGTDLGFAVLAGSTVTNTGSSAIVGNVGVSTGTSITGFPPGTVTGGTFHPGDAVAATGQTDLTTAYNAAAGAACGDNLTGHDLGGLTLTPGVYCFSSAAQLTGTLVLNALGNSKAQFIFQIGSGLTTASSASVDFINGGQGDGVVWQVGSSATLGTGTAFAGSILAASSITFDTGASIECGRALARSGAVTLDTNAVSIATPGCGGTAVPEAPSAALLGAGIVLLGLIFRPLRQV